MITMTAAAVRHIEARGYKPVFEVFGVAGCGKTTAATDQADRFRRKGFDVLVQDEIERPDGMSGVRVWARAA